MENTRNNPIIQKISASLIKNSRGKIPVKVKIRKDTETETLKWDEGEHEDKYFENHGNTIDGCKFFADGPDVYTVFVKDKDGNSEVRTITVKYAMPFFVAPVTAILLLTLVIGSVVFASTFYAKAPLLPGRKPAAVQQAVSNSAPSRTVSKNNSVTDTIWTAALFHSGEKGSSGTWKFSNIQKNNVIMQAEIFVGKNRIATSPALYPGHGVKNITLQRYVSKGNYKATAYVNYYDLKTRYYMTTAIYHIGVSVD